MLTFIQKATELRHPTSTTDGILFNETQAIVFK